MAIILLSFVGKQDPFSPKNGEEGSIVTLVKELSTENQIIKHSILLHTEGTLTEAELTKDWIEENYTCENIILIAVNNELSDDPVNLTLAIQEAKKALKFAQKLQHKGDRLALNASSGTPIMKSAWAILQTAGYAPLSNVWQVRHPDQVRINQKRVFTTNLNSIKKEIDLKVISQQIQNYNYSGALFTIKKSLLYHPKIEDAIIYGKFRLAFNFNQAYSQVNKHQDKAMKNLANDISLLRQKHILSLLQEVYFKASIKLKQKEYADFLVWLVAFQENLLKYLLIQKISPQIISFNKKWRDIEIELIDKIKIFDQGKLYEKITTKYSNISYLNIPIMMRIVSYIKKDEQELLNKIKSIDRYVQERNLYIHEITGVNDIYNPEALEKSMFKILQLLTKMPDKNPFDILNKIILVNLNTITNQH
ncbi:hypothetical protein [Geminocystis sp.]|uniref:hypothetical protein n=1 Tax=Geminocystis sp. TaxID=2664100 RepID=UPI0035943E5C